MQPNIRVSIKERNYPIEIAKGILIILMIVGHSGATNWLESMIYTFYISCFFLITRCLICGKYIDNVLNFIRKRFRSFWWPFFKWIGFFLLLHNIFHRISIYPESYSINKLIRSNVATGFFIHVEQLSGIYRVISSLFFLSIFTIIYCKFYGLSIKSLIMYIFLCICTAYIFVVLPLKIHYLTTVHMLASAYFLGGIILQKFKLADIFYIKKITVFLSIFLITISSNLGKIHILNSSSNTLIIFFLYSIIIFKAFLIIETFRDKKYKNFFMNFGDKILDILILHFLEFRLISYIKFKIFNMEYSNKQDQLVLIERNE